MRYMLLLVNSSALVNTMPTSPTPKKADAITLPNDMSRRLCINTQKTNTTIDKNMPAPSERSM